ncbi:DUF262 domain-containing protein [Mangrovimonas sp. DI 80]|uniref:DUF262 domain-containing protein n=1 Tax=Mangrovimonas sp. DI 80 TaxID=1779330 RepID=UPI0009766D0F|nr:DUF262 domain-containing protein [Mangrovimonas sp. DI 80]OMP32277.1 hypothetical protein BKM32_04290 [Mangrovimonas sp. DI 80]
MDLHSIHEIFTNRILRIPAYQRGYAWSNNKKVNPDSKEPLKNVKGQLIDLWNDLINIPEGKWHYTGLLTLVEVKPCDYNWLPNFKQYSIVDGQQRITSILILLSVIIKEAKKQKVVLGIREGDVEMQYLFINKGVNAYIFGYDKDNPSDKFFRKHILSLDEIEDDSEESTYTENLLKAKHFFESMVSIYLQNEENDVQSLFNRVTTQLKLNEYILPEELDEYVVFETMNNRGKPLSQLEKLKNRLLYLNDKYQVTSSSIEEINLNKAQKKNLENSINKAWITIYKSLGQNKARPLDDEDFIKNHWIAYFNKYSRDEANVYANFLFDEHFSLDNVYNGSLKREDIKDYIKSLQKCSVWFNKLHNLNYFEESDKTIRKAIQGIHHVGLKASFKPILLAILTRDDRNDFVGTIKTLEKFSFKLFDLSDKRGNTGDSKIYELAHQVYVKNKTADETKTAIEIYTSWYYRFHLFANQTYELFELGHKQGFFKWSGRFYLLYQYDKHLRNKNKTSTESSAIAWSDFVKNDSIEHIYPQSATVSLKAYAEQKGKEEIEVEDAYNRIQNNWSHFTEYTPEQRRKLANSLGNLLALSKSDNSSFQNDPFLYKVDQSNKGERYLNRGYKYDSMSAMIVANESEWTPEKVLDRGLKMLKFLCDYVGEDFGAMSDETKYKVLGLDFLLIKQKETELPEATLQN